MSEQGLRPGKVQAFVGALGLCAGGAALVWVANIAQAAGDTPQPELIEAQMLFLGVPSAALWALAAWVVTPTVSRRTTWFWAVVVLAVVPWTILCGSVVDVLVEVCSRPGGRCG